MSSKKIIDSKIGDDNLLDCPINRNKWTLPSILQWYRSINNYSIPIASQFGDYPAHIDDLFVNKYSLSLNGTLTIENTQLNDNDTFECRLIFIDRGLLDLKERYFVTLRVNGILYQRLIYFKSFFLCCFQKNHALSISPIRYKLLHNTQQ